MGNHLNRIYQILQKLLGLHRQLLDTVRMERDALAAADVKGVQDAAYAKEALVEAIRQQEAARMKLASELSVIWKCPLEQLTISNIIIRIQAVDSKGADQLRTAFNALTILIQRIKDQNNDNRELIERSLEHVYNMKKNVLGEKTPRSDTYSQQGQRVNASKSGGSRLISKEA